MDDARVNESPGGVAEDDRLEFCDRKELSELDEVGNELESAKGDRKVSCLLLTNTKPGKCSQ